MTKDLANRILNELRAGRNFPKIQIRRALTVTGDLPVCADTKDAFDSYSRDIEHEDDPLPIRRIHRPVGTWEGLGDGVTPNVEAHRLP